MTFLQKMMGKKQHRSYKKTIIFLPYCLAFKASDRLKRKIICPEQDMKAKKGEPSQKSTRFLGLRNPRFTKTGSKSGEMVVCAVRAEPLSVEKFPIAAYFTGKFSKMQGYFARSPLC
jgi:hypothetical protein